MVHPAAAPIAPGALDAAAVSSHLRSARARMLAVTAGLDGERLLGPQLEIVNPVLWELGHVGWFQERWCLRYRLDGMLAPSRRADADALYDSSAVAHDRRWTLPLPSLAETRRDLDEVLARVLGAIERAPRDDRLLYFAELSACHEDMHVEACHYTRQTLSYPRPPFGDTAPARRAGAAAATGDAEYAGGRFLLGAVPGGGFVHDNEKWAHAVEILPFRMARAAVTNADYLAFVTAGGYDRSEWWSAAGWEWRRTAGAEGPVYWARRGGEWLQRRFDQWVPLAPDEPVVHVSGYEAEAYCRFAGRRLPSEAEWEFAACNGCDAPKSLTPWGGAATDPGRARLEESGPAPVGAHPGGDNAQGCRQLLGNVWEWTASVFAPYSGFVPDPYAEYSAPWFGTRWVLRGGSFATPARLVRNTWRNFFTPDRRDVFAGFRTCALDG